MADIELVIKVDKKIYKEALKSGYSHLYDEEVANAVANGIPLPKGHGRLIDADVAIKEFNRRAMDWEGGVIDCIPTIVEADKAGEE